MTELFIALNTEKCTSGATTRARFCSLVNLQSNDFHTAVKIVQQKSLRKQYKANRMAQTIEYMKARKILLVSNKAGGGQPVQNLCDEIKDVLTKARMDKIYGFTDGSPRPREKVANSGLGIALYGADKKLLWEGGMGIRTEGNNYVAELAAAAILLSSVPYQVHLTLFSDCLSAINTLGLPPLSERKRLRTPARIWAAMGQDARQKRPDLVIQHVKSHQGTATFEQIGNDRADQMAKHYLGLTEHDKPITYYAIGDTKVEVRHNEKTLSQDIRKFLEPGESRNVGRMESSPSARTTGVALPYKTRKTCQKSVEMGHRAKKRPYLDFFHSLGSSVAPNQGEKVQRTEQRRQV